MDSKIVLSNIPPVGSNVADARPSDVQQVPAPVAAADPVILQYCDDCGRELWEGTPCVCKVAGIRAPKVKRAPVDHQTSRLYWPFIILMGKIAHYANEKYGSVEQYADGRLEGEKSPINHICGHISDYVSRKPHDKFGNLQMQLAAIAYNAMMECLYLDQSGEPTVPSKLYDSVKKESK